MKSEGNKKFDFWQDHSVHYLEMAYRTDKRERIATPDGYGRRTGQCGDTIEMFLTIRDDLIRSASFDTDGCLNTMACANAVVFMIEGRTIAQAWGISVENIVDYLATLPSTQVHCAELAVGALYLALSDFEAMKRDSWKKLYKKDYMITA